MGQRIRLTENDLHNLISEAVSEVLNEGFGDRVNGAIRGFQSGAKKQSANEYNTGELEWILSRAKKAVQYGDPQNALEVLKEILYKCGQQ